MEIPFTFPLGKTTHTGDEKDLISLSSEELFSLFYSTLPLPPALLLRPVCTMSSPYTEWREWNGKSYGGRTLTARDIEHRASTAPPLTGLYAVRAAPPLPLCRARVLNALCAAGGRVQCSMPIRERWRSS